MWISDILTASSLTFYSDVITRLLLPLIVLSVIASECNN